MSQLLLCPWSRFASHFINRADVTYCTTLTSTTASYGFFFGAYSQIIHFKVGSSEVNSIFLLDAKMGKYILKRETIVGKYATLLFLLDI